MTEDGVAYPRTGETRSTTITGRAVFADAGNAWCTEQERASDRFHTCPSAADPPLAAVGAEMGLTIGVLHGIPLMVRYGLAVPVSGRSDRDVVFHLGLGPSF